MRTIPKSPLTSQAILFLLPLTTLAVMQSLNDFTVLPKNFLVLLAGGLSFSVLIVHTKEIFAFKNMKLWAPPVSFMVAIFTLALLSNFHYKSFFGEYGRYNGALQYISLTLIFLYVVFFFNKTDAKYYLYLLGSMGALTSLIGILQKLGLDLIGYAGESKEVASTFGNSNFASAFIGISAVGLLFLLFSSKNLWMRTTSVAFLLTDILAIALSGSSQGFFALAAELFILLLYVVIRFNARLLYPYLALSVFSAISIFFGLLQKGPLTGLVYQPSTTYRGNYFRAGISMFQDKPLTGVGIDRFGDYYRSYRDLAAISNSGASATTNYAHNLFIQFAATGGIVLLLSFLILTGSIYYFVLRNLKNLVNQKDLLTVSLIAAWFAYSIIGLVSIDELGIAFWGWVAGALVLARTRNLQQVMAPIKITFGKTYISQTLQLFSVISLLVLFVPIFQADKAYKNAISTSSSNPDVSYLDYLDTQATRAYELNSNEINYLIAAADTNFRTGKTPMATDLLVSGLQINPQSYPLVMTLAQLYMATGSIMDEISIREKLILIDPLGRENLVRLSQLYAISGNQEKVDDMSSRLAALK